MKKRILYIAQELSPFLNGTEIAEKVLELATFVQNHKDYEVRIFIPRYGCVNQRRHQLHEVIRLSGINLVINDIDQPLIIKVGSVQKAKLQVYFIDNDEYFKRKGILKDSKNNIFKDNDERMMFFCQGVLETLIMLRWTPDIIHCSGWISSLIPMYLKEKYNEASVFEHTKVIYSLYKDSFVGSLNKNLKTKILFDELNDTHLSLINTPSAKNLHKLAIQYSDFVDIKKSFNNKDVFSFIEKLGIESNGVSEDQSFDELLEVYNNLCATEVV
jgi:starch synthase